LGPFLFLTEIVLEGHGKGLVQPFCSGSLLTIFSILLASDLKSFSDRILR
jgi:hypothetical protein